MQLHTHYEVRQGGAPAPKGAAQWVLCIVNMLNDHTMYNAVINDDSDTKFTIYFDDEYEDIVTQDLHNQLTFLAVGMDYELINS